MRTILYTVPILHQHVTLIDMTKFEINFLPYMYCTLIDILPIKTSPLKIQIAYIFLNYMETVTLKFVEINR